MNLNLNLTSRAQSFNFTRALNLTTCGHNSRYDKRGAITQINRIAKLRGRHGRPINLRAYPCEFCQGWHLTKAASEDAED